MAPSKEHDTAHLDKFSAEELEDILVQLCDSEGVKVSPDDDKALKNLGKNALGGIGKKLFGKGDDKKPEPPQSPASSGEANPAPEPEAPAPAPVAPRPASDLIRELNLGDKKGLIEVLQNVLATALTGDVDGKSGGNPLFACFGKLLKGGGTKSRNAVESSSTNQETQADGASAPAGDAAAGGMPSMEDIKTPEALFKFITSNPAVKTMVISGVQTFLAKAMQQAQGAKS